MHECNLRKQLIGRRKFPGLVSAELAILRADEDKVGCLLFR